MIESDIAQQYGVTFWDDDDDCDDNCITLHILKSIELYTLNG